MLKEIACVHFNHGVIKFHQGLNVILGDDDAKNSIGKSTALMVVDFVQGGNSFLSDEAGVIKALGHHHYNFSFIFGGIEYYFSRSTNYPEVVEVCNEKYARSTTISIDDFRIKLKNFYGLERLESSYRGIVSPFSRIWKKGGLEPDQPFIGSLKEAAGVAISRLIDLFGRSGDIVQEKKIIDEQRERKKLISSSMNAEIIPSIKKSQYDANIRSIQDNSEKIEELKQGFGGALNAYEALFDQNLRKMKHRKNEISDLRNELQIKIRRLQREISGITPRLSANIALVAEFFPTINIEKVEKVEAFHQKIGSIVKKELKDELATSMSKDSTLRDESLALDEDIRLALESKGMPDDLFNRVFELKEVTDKAIEENKYFEKKVNLEEAIKVSALRLDAIYTRIFLDIESKVNLKLKSFNKVVYGAKRNSSELRIKNSGSYSFTSPDDTGTGKSYAGLIGFDAALLSLTRLPFVIHDSVIYKNIEVAATKRILRILSAIKTKQVFLSFDEAHKYGKMTEQLLMKYKVLKLGHNELLYNRDWREKK